jgi:hypothetical protein
MILPSSATRKTGCCVNDRESPLASSIPGGEHETGDHTSCV